MGDSHLGWQRIRWAESRMPVLRQIREKWRAEKPLAGLRIAACLHVTSETANLVFTLKDGGARVTLCASNPLSTQEDVAAALREEGIPTYAKRGADERTYFSHIMEALSIEPHFTIDDGADLVFTLHEARPGLLSGVVGGTEETTTGVTRLKQMARRGMLRYPIIAVNDALTKYMFDNRYGTGQSSLDGIIRATNVLLAGKTVVVAGYGWCGRGIARRASGLGARVVVVEADPVRALEAAMDGFWVMTMDEASAVGDVFVTATGNKDVIGPTHYEKMKDGALLANAGHFDVEIDVRSLRRIAASRKEVRPGLEEFRLHDGRSLLLIGEGRLVNLAAAEGHPAEVMDMSFANQALCIEWLNRNRGLPAGVHPVPVELDRAVASLKLASMGMRVQELSAEQKRYIGLDRARAGDDGSVEP